MTRGYRFTRFPLIYHARRILGAPDNGLTALLGDEDYPVTRSWPVEKPLVADKQPAKFDLPNLEGHALVKVMPHQKQLPDFQGQDSGHSEGADHSKWFPGDWTPTFR
ncbi:hypothetical protein RKD54_000829 [Pseudarthrobacter sp. SLBN-100]|uniref:hypothetical protein n=1 Tax=Arthrobacter sp. SLBN-100 TaxID=2768450 RepID=UPI0011535091|nr:hypothetical protein [Arthrobacter sp. SLBN-100]